MAEEAYSPISTRSCTNNASGEEGVRYGLWLAAILSALTLWRVGALYFSRTELFFDEAQYWAWSQELAFGYYSKPPFIAWLIRGSTSLCGDSEFCVRLSSPLVHTATAVLVFLIGHRLYTPRIGFWSAIVFATLPGVSFSAGLISTDVPLLFFWAAALYAFIIMMEEKSWTAAIGLGLAFGFGLLAKYAMIYFLLCAALYAVWDGHWRRLVSDIRLYAALGLGALLILPNLLWNAEHKFATFSHTADNAKWSGSMFNISEALEFFASQAGVFGIILFVTLLWASWRAWRNGANSTERLLLSFSIPVIILITIQAFLSRAHGNWAATAYVAATVFVTAELLALQARYLFNASLGMHLTALAILGAGNAAAGSFTLPGGADPYERVLGWKATAEAAEKRVLMGGFKALATDKRALTAEFIYYGRNGSVPVVSLLEPGRKPKDHFEMTRPITAETPQPILLVSFKPKTDRLEQMFDLVEPFGSEQIETGVEGKRTVYFFRLQGFKGTNQ